MRRRYGFEVDLVDIERQRPPMSWGVRVDDAAIARVADAWKNDTFPLPTFDYPGTPAVRDESWWFDYVTLSVSVLACLWPPDGDDMWHCELDGQWLDDAPGIFAAFTKMLETNAHGEPTLDVAKFAHLDEAAGAAIFQGRGTLQMIPERVDLLRRVASTITERWDGSARNLVEDADRDGSAIAAALSATMPAYQDRPATAAGTLPFDKLSHLAAAIMAAGAGWSDGGFHGYDDFPVYPDYMLPRVLRHLGVLEYDAELAAAIDGQTLIAADSDYEHGLRWATVFAGAELRRALLSRGVDVPSPGLDYRLWSEAVLGPNAASFGEHHRTLTLCY